MWYDDFGDESNFPEPEELNVPTGTAKVITDVVEDLCTFDVDAYEPPSVLSDYWSLTGIAKPSKPDGPPFENVLDQFASYAPLWTLACLTPEQFNDPRIYRGNPRSLQSIIFSSAGRFDGQRTQTVVGAPEYFVNNFNLECNTAPNMKTGFTNFIKMEFEVYEPYSMTYFIQSLQTAAINSGYPSYNSAPFLLMLEFFGHRDNGQMFASTEELKKYFTVKITKVTFTTTEGGTVYKVTAVPYNHTGWTNVAQQTKIDIKIKGENVKEMLVSGQYSLVSVLNREEQSLVPSKQDYADEYLVVFPKNWADKVGLPGEAPIPEESYSTTADPDEPYTQPLVNRPGQYTQNFGLGEIGASSLGFGATSGGNYSFGFENDVIDEETGLIRRNTLLIDPKQREFQFKKKTTVQNIIQQVILSSEYAKNAINPAKLDKATGRIKWFRVDVQIELGPFDGRRNERQKKYIFRVMPFYVHSSVFRTPGKNPPGMGELNRIVGKEYYYIYTGKNNNIIKYDIQINQLFNHGMNPTKLENTESVTNPDQNQVSEDPDQTDRTPVDGDVTNMATTLGSPPSLRDMEVTEETTKGGYGAQTVAQRVALMLKNKILQEGSTGDMITTNLEIIGDPYWLVDSGMGNYIADLWDDKNQERGERAMITADGGMNYEGTDTYIRIVFATPIEPNLGTTGTGGLYNFPRGKINPYSGVYKVLKCQNKFSDGKFTQTLQCSRMAQQPQDFDGGYEPDKNPFGNDISQEDRPKASPNDDAPEWGTIDVNWDDVDLLGLPPGPTDEEIAQNNADLGDFNG